AVGQPLRRVAVAQFGERERAARGDLERALDGRRIVGEQAGERVWALQVVLGVRLEAAAGGVDGDAFADAGEHVLQWAARGRVVEHLVGGDDRDAGAARAVAQARFGVDLLGAAVARGQRVQAIAERGAQLVERPRAEPQRGEAGRALGDLAPRDPA